MHIFPLGYGEFVSRLDVILVGLSRQHRLVKKSREAARAVDLFQRDGFLCRRIRAADDIDRVFILGREADQRETVVCLQMKIVRGWGC